MRRRYCEVCLSMAAIIGCATWYVAFGMHVNPHSYWDGFSE